MSFQRSARQAPAKAADVFMCIFAKAALNAMIARTFPVGRVGSAAAMLFVNNTTCLRIQPLRYEFIICIMLT
jgi:hypothetical protein